MTLHQHPERHSGLRFTPWRKPGTASGPVAETDSHETAAASTFTRTAAGLRLLTAVVFLWAFFDKTFGWGYATPSGKGWVDGGSPTEGFLGGVSAGPLESTFHSWAGDSWADWSFMLGLLGIGVALLSGVALRLAAVAGTTMMALMWAAEWPPAKHLSDGSSSMSTNPIVDYHVLYAAVLIALAVLCAGRAWGLGKAWESLPFVRDNSWLR